MKKRIFIFLREYLMMGGIETYIYEHAKKLKDEGCIVIWVKHPKAQIDSSFEHVFFDGKTIVWDRKINLKKLNALVPDQDWDITIITFDMFSFAYAEQIKTKFTRCPVQTFYFVPNFVGPTLYLEEAYKGKLQERVRVYMRGIVQRMQKAENVRYFSEKHFQKMMTSYEYTITDKNSYFVPPGNNDFAFDEGNCRTLAKRERFNLMTVSRFDFPHKGYILGLIDAYAQLKEQYPRLELTIVGYGKDLPRVEKAISMLPDYAQAGIRLYGKVSQEDLAEYYLDANLNISVAGCCTGGAKMGTLSMPARHFDYSCEVYGFLPESKPFTVSDAPGEPVVPYIEKVLNMTEDEYVAACKAAYDTFHDGTIESRKGMLEIRNNAWLPTMTKREISIIQLMEVFLKIRVKLRRAMGKLNFLPKH